VGIPKCPAAELTVESSSFWATSGPCRESLTKLKVIIGHRSPMMANGAPVLSGTGRIHWPIPPRLPLRSHPIAFAGSLGVETHAERIAGAVHEGALRIDGDAKYGNQLRDRRSARHPGHPVKGGRDAACLCC
jgi:hypothetical protein